VVAPVSWEQLEDVGEPQRVDASRLTRRDDRVETGDVHTYVHVADEESSSYREQLCEAQSRSLLFSGASVIDESAEHVPLVEAVANCLASGLFGSAVVSWSHAFSFARAGLDIRIGNSRCESVPTASRAFASYSAR
jgi:hypothetical protein